MLGKRPRASIRPAPRSANVAPLVLIFRRPRSRAPSRRSSSRATAARTKSVRSSRSVRTASVRSKVPSGNRASAAFLLPTDARPLQASLVHKRQRREEFRPPWQLVSHAMPGQEARIASGPLSTKLLKSRRRKPLHRKCPLLMLWTAPPPARECQRGGGCLRLPRFGGATHASDYNNRSGHREVCFLGSWRQMH